MVNASLVYTPEEVGKMLKLNKATVYGLIKNGEIVAKKLGKVYRVPAKSLSFAFTGLDWDLYQAEKEDLKKISVVEKGLEEVRKEM